MRIRPFWDLCLSAHMVHGHACPPMPAFGCAWPCRVMSACAVSFRVTLGCTPFGCTPFSHNSTTEMPIGSHRVTQGHAWPHMAAHPSPILWGGPLHSPLP